MTDDLLDVLEPHTDLRRVSQREMAGACPFCGGEDRFRVWPDEDPARWWCRRCERSGDAITLLRTLHGLSFPEAAERVWGPGWRERDRSTTAPSTPPSRPVPSSRWDRRARAFLTLCRYFLWQRPAGAPVRAYLRGQRRLYGATVAFWGLGYNPVDRRDPPQRWGFPADDPPVWIPSGIVIPWTEQGRTVGIKIRRPTRADPPKYVQVRGSRCDLFALDELRGHRPAVLVEGEFDAILLHQEANDLATPVTVGGAAAPLSPRSRWALRDVPRLLVAYDCDPAGMLGAATVVRALPRARPVRPLGANDLTDLQQRGGDLRLWLASILNGEI